MAINKNILCGLDINKTNICFARCFPENRLIDHICIQPLEMGGVEYWESVNNGCDEFLKGIKISQEEIATCLSGENALIKKVTLDRDETEIEAAIEWELSQQLIGAIEEYVYDYQHISNLPEGNSQKYLVVGYRRVAVERLHTLLRQKKINPAVIDLDIFALINVYEINYKDRLTLPALIVHTESCTTKLILTKDGNFIDLDVFDLSDEAMAPERYTEELKKYINNLFTFNQGFSENSDTHIYITGSYFFLGENQNAIIESLPNAEVLYPFRKISCSSGMDETKLHEYAPQLAVSVGLTLRSIE